MKLIFISIILIFSQIFLFSFIKSDDCQYCLKNGETIPDSNVIGDVYCLLDDQYETLNETSEIFSCSNKNAKGGDCEENFSCISDTCINDICTQQYYLQLGDTCTVEGENFDCYSELCTNGVCSLPADGNCQTFESDCPIGKYCNHIGECVDQIKVGQEFPEVDETSYGCVLGAAVLDDVCVEYFTVQEGLICDPNSNFEFCDISKGLFCNSSSTCAKYQTTNTNDCLSQDVFCNSNEYCDCTTKKCVQQQILTTECENTHKSFFTCLLKNNCNPEVNEDPETCMVKKCGAELCKSNLCSGGTNDCGTVSASMCSKYLTNSTSSSDSKSSESSSASKLSFSLTLFFAYLIFNLL